MPEQDRITVLEERVTKLEKTAETAVTIAKKVAAALLKQFGIKLGVVAAICAFGALPVVAAETIFNPVGEKYSSGTFKVMAESGSSSVTCKTDVVVATTVQAGTVNATSSMTLSTNLVVNSTKASTDKDTGAIVTEGGVGVEKTINAGGAIKTVDTTAANSTSTGSGIFGGGVGIAGKAYIGDTVTLTTNLVVSGSDASTSKDTGAVVVEGGLGVEKNVYAGGFGSFQGLKLAYTAKTAAYVPTTADFTMVHTPGAIYTNTLPDANTVLGQVWCIKSASGANDMMVNTDGTDTLDAVGNKQGLFADTDDTFIIQATGADTWTILFNSGVVLQAIP